METILIVDHSALRRRILTTALARVEGVRSVSAGSASEALDRLAEPSISLVVTDVFLPVITGLDLLHWMGSHSRFRSIPVIVLTAWADDALRREALAAGASAYLTMPAHPAHLLARIREVLRRTVPSCSTDAGAEVPSGELAEAGASPPEKTASGPTSRRVRDRSSFSAPLAHLDTIGTPSGRRQSGGVSGSHGPNGSKPFRSSQRDDDPLADDVWPRRRQALEQWLARADAREVKQWIARLHKRPEITTASGLFYLLAMTVEEVFDPLVALVNDPDPLLRQLAVMILGERYEEQAIPALIAAMADPDSNVQFHAVEAVGRLRAAEAVPALVPLVRSPCFFVAAAAVDVLGRIGSSAVARELIPLLEDEWLNRPVVQALKDIGTPAEIAVLVAQLNREKAPVAAVAQALEAIAKRHRVTDRESAPFSTPEFHRDMPNPRAPDPTATAIRGSIASQMTAVGRDNLIRAAAEASDEDAPALAFLLARVDDESADRALLHLVRFESARTRAVEALVCRGPRVTPLLMDLLRDGETAIQRVVAIALGRLRDPRAIAVLARTLVAVPEVTNYSAQALSRLCDERAFDRLRQLLAHADSPLRRAVMRALASVQHPTMSALALSLLGDPDPRVREAAVNLVNGCRSPEGIVALLERCRDEDETVRMAAVECLATVDDPRVLSTLTQVLTRDTPRVREAAARALGRVKNVEATVALVAALCDGDPWVRCAAARSLGEQDAREAVDDLARLATMDATSEVRVAAIEALGQIGGSRAQAILSALCEAGDSRVAQAALSALGQLDHPRVIWVLLAALGAGDVQRRLHIVRLLTERRGVLATTTLHWLATNDPDERVVRAALDGLAYRATPADVAALIEVAADAPRRPACIAALARLGPHRLPEIARGLRHPDPDVRRAVVQVLATSDEPSAAEALVAALDDEEASVRRTAATALAGKDAPAVRAPLILRARSDPDPTVRRAARDALRRSE